MQVTTQGDGALSPAVTFANFFAALGLEVEDAPTMDKFVEFGQFERDPEYYYFLTVPGTGGQRYQAFQAADGRRFELRRVQWNPVAKCVAIFGKELVGQEKKEFILTQLEFPKFLLEHGLNVPAVVGSPERE